MAAIKGCFTPDAVANSRCVIPVAARRSLSRSANVASSIDPMITAALSSGYVAIPSSKLEAPVETLAGLEEDPLDDVHQRRSDLALLVANPSPQVSVRIDVQRHVGVLRDRHQSRTDLGGVGLAPTDICVARDRCAVDDKRVVFRFPRDVKP